MGESVEEFSVGVISFDRDFFAVHANKAEAALSLVRVFGDAGGGETMVKRIGVSEDELINAVFGDGRNLTCDFPATHDVLVAIENGRDIVPVQNFPESISLRRIKIKTFSLFVTHRISRFVKYGKSIFFFVGG